MPIDVGMMAKMQLGQTLGNMALTGVDTAGNFVIFGIMGKSIDDTAVMALMPVADYDAFISASIACGAPDANGVSKVTSAYGDKTIEKMQIVKAGKYAMLTGPGSLSYGALLKATKAGGMESNLDADEAAAAKTEPLWAYVDMEKLRPEALKGLAKARKEFKNISTADMPAGFDMEKIMGIYLDIAETLVKESKSASAGVNITADLCRIKTSYAAAAGTETAGMLVVDSSAAGENKLLAYLKDGAAMNLGFNINKPLWKKLQPKSIDLLSAICGENFKTEEAEKWKKLATDELEALGNSGAFSMAVNTSAKPPIDVSYIVEIKDKAKYDKLLNDQMAMLNDGFLSDLYKDMGMEMKLEMQRSVDNYNGVSIDSAKLAIAMSDTNSPESAMIDAMYGGGFDYKFAMVDDIFACAIADDSDKAIRKLIDEVKNRPQVGGEITKAMAMLSDAKTADFVGTINYVRFMGMSLNMMTQAMGDGAAMNMPPFNPQSKSNIAFAGKVGNGKVLTEIALPKEHLTELSMAAQQMAMMQMQMMQMQQQQMQQNNSPN